MDLRLRRQGAVSYQAKVHRVPQNKVMTRIADLLVRDVSKPVDDIVKISDDDPDVVVTELTEYIATDRIKTEYEKLFRGLAAAPKSPNECVGIWISGGCGAGK